ncbi:general stress protein CsbD [Paraflavitalea sp. CAU 1676]|uniref:general stress protein CsbD n=1 Tax=Paraflavitalea sp. CAU 1676 TaxID=3032598 RepID=UPI0023DAF287|nr:general stress protein CsbD [Paraflavitalea sp. CAU 1676]MDF2191105.1 general stress protein CsbD [Paraflavitalea sp. CAU 1676]
MDTSKLILHTPWDEVKEKIKERNIGLTDEDLDYEPGHEDELLERLAAKMNRTKDDVKRFIESVSFNQDMAS